MLRVWDPGDWPSCTATGPSEEASHAPSLSCAMPRLYQHAGHNLINPQASRVGVSRAHKTASHRQKATGKAVSVSLLGGVTIDRSQAKRSIGTANGANCSVEGRCVSCEDGFRVAGDGRLGCAGAVCWSSDDASYPPNSKVEGAEEAERHTDETPSETATVATTISSGVCVPLAHSRLPAMGRAE